MWTDPSTGERFSVDSRTGHSYRQSEYLPEHVEASALSREARLTFALPKIDSLVPTKRGSNVGPGLVPAWLEHAFKVCLSFVSCVLNLLTTKYRGTRHIPWLKVESPGSSRLIL